MGIFSRLSRFTAGILLTAALLSAQPGSIAGTILSDTGEPIARATVSAHFSVFRTAAETEPLPTPPPPITTETGMDGKFLIENVAPGAYSVRARRRGFVGTNYMPSGQRNVLNPVTVAPGQTVTGIDIVMPREGVITGRVLDENGDPVAGIQLAALRTQFIAAQIVRTTVAAAVSDDASAVDLPPGGEVPGQDVKLIRVTP